MWNRGKIVIVAIVLVAIAATAFSTWYHYRGQHRVLAFWGPTTALLIAEAPHVEVLKLDELAVPSGDVPMPEETAGQQNQESRVEFGGLAWKVLETKDAARARGISNLRRELILDATYDWTALADNDEPDWQFAMGFNDGKQWATILFNLDSGRVALTGGKNSAALDPAASDLFLEFFLEQFPEAAAETPAKPAASSDEKPAESAPKADDRPVDPHVEKSD